MSSAPSVIEEWYDGAGKFIMELEMGQSTDLFFHCAVFIAQVVILRRKLPVAGFDLATI